MPEPRDDRISLDDLTDHALFDLGSLSWPATNQRDVAPQYGTCERCGRIGYEVEVACSTCYITLCPFCEHDCEEVSDAN